jgi:two-component system response regulator FixJ
VTDQARIFVVDDDDAVRDSLSILLSSVGYVVEQFHSAPAFLARESESIHGCVLVDVRMPDMDGLQLQEELQKRRAKLRVIVITGHADVPLAVRAMKAGAIDFLEKPVNRAELLSSIEKALKDPPQVSWPGSEVEAARRRIAELTGRERDVFELLVAGDQSKVIAHKLSISPRTVQVHRGRVMHKLEVTSLQDLVRLAITARES